MLDILTDTERLSSEAELLLDRFEGGDHTSRMVGAIEVPGVEAGKVLKRAEEFVATDWDGQSGSAPRSMKTKRVQRENAGRLCKWMGDFGRGFSPVVATNRR